MSPFVLALLLCAAEVLGMLSFSTFQALIPEFRNVWSLSNSEAGWISGVYFAGYVAAVPVLSSLTDRIDPKRVVLGSLALAALSAAAFGMFAAGFWSALVLRALHGIGLAGTYMPLLKALSDQTEGPKQSRYVAFYTASFGIGAALSFVIAGEAATRLGWDWAFHAAAAGAALAFTIVLVVLPRTEPHAERPDFHLLDFRPVFRNRQAMSFILGYAGHNWELFAFRSWTVTFLVYAATREGTDPWLAATSVAAVATLIGVPASILGNEAALRFGRRRWIMTVTAASVALCIATGFAGGAAYGLGLVCVLAYGFLATADSAALTAGTVAAAEPGRRGATLAMHAAIGFVGGIIGPPAVGVTLDFAGGETSLGWGLAFIVVGLGSALAFLVISRARV